MAIDRVLYVNTATWVYLLPLTMDKATPDELEASFAYPETPDQLRVIAQVKEDMERSQPMDRLICGDVGYGKTEVALRAAFKTVMDDRQVAMLVPTTVLAQQVMIAVQVIV